MINHTFTELLELIKEYNPEEIPKLTKAYEIASKLHDGQRRKSGEPYISHPVNVCYILATMYADGDTLCAALLHDTLEDTSYTKKEISKDFNDTVAFLVDNVSIIKGLDYVEKSKESDASIRKLMFSITKDVRTVIIKLADRLHNMRTIDVMSEESKIRNAKETMMIFAPFANRIGAFRIKSELEDLCLQYLDPNTFKTLTEFRAELEREHTIYLDEMGYTITRILSSEDIDCKIKTRFKNVYGIYRKLKEGKEIHNIHDLMTLKICVSEVRNCYESIGLIHGKYAPVPGRMKDYIATPKPNLYQSFHSTVIGPANHMVQVQLRTYEMDRTASFGITSYWRDSRGLARDKMQQDLHKKFQFYESLSDIIDISGSDEELIDGVKREILGTNIVIYVNDGVVVELPLGSSVVDLIYRLGGNILSNYSVAYIDGVEVPIDYKLKNNQKVIIKTSDMSFAPGLRLEHSAYTMLAKKKIEEFRNNRH